MAIIPFVKRTPMMGRSRAELDAILKARKWERRIDITLALLVILVIVAVAVSEILWP